jgi:hypothetical protein
MNPELISQVKTFAPILSNVPQLFFDNQNVNVTDEMKKSNAEFLAQFKRTLVGAVSTGLEEKSVVSPNTTKSIVPTVWSFAHNYESQDQLSKLDNKQKSLWNQVLFPSAAVTPVTTTETPPASNNMIDVAEIEEIISKYKQAIAIYQVEYESMCKKIDELERNVNVLEEKLKLKNET